MMYFALLNAHPWFICGTICPYSQASAMVTRPKGTRQTRHKGVHMPMTSATYLEST
jgi:hypothetical protein